MQTTFPCGDMPYQMLESIEKTLEYSFVNPNLLITALTHRSYRDRIGSKLVQATNYERLEFLGDAVLELIVTEYLYLNFEKNEGELTAIRSQVVNRFVLARIGQILKLDTAIRISEQEKAEMGKARDSIVADAVEAVIGALYLEAGYEFVQRFVLTHIVPEIESLLANNTLKDPKTELQELTQKKFKLTPLYKTLSSKGKDHQKEFECGVYIHNKYFGSAWGKSKQEAQTACAAKALACLITIETLEQLEKYTPQSVSIDNNTL